MRSVLRIDCVAKYRPMKYCPKCNEVVVTKALGSYSQIDFKGVPVKRRKIAHLEEDGGCGCEWYTVEVVEDVLGIDKKLQHRK